MVGLKAKFNDLLHPRGDNPANRGQFATVVLAEQDGSLVDHRPVVTSGSVPLDPYGRPNYCRWNEWYWTVRPHVKTHRDAIDDATWNWEHSLNNPPEPRNPAQIAAFWASYDTLPADGPRAVLRDNLKNREEEDWARDFYLWESGHGLDELGNSTIVKQKKVAKFDQMCQEWARSIPNPVHQETPTDMWVALNMYTDARILDAREGKNPDDRDSATNLIGYGWQTSTGRTPKELVETCRLAHIMDIERARAFVGKDFIPSESGESLYYRKRRVPWTGNRAYVKPVNPWAEMEENELF